MLNITRETNQYYGKYFENAICACINHDVIENKTGFSDFSKEDLEIMNEDAAIMANFLNAKNAVWTGNETSNQNCDLIVDNSHIEIKYVSNGTGTYFNTSIATLKKYGFDYKAFLIEKGYYDFLNDILKELNIKANERNQSPVSQTNSSKIRHNYPDIYEKIQLREQDIRKEFLNAIITYFQDNTDVLYTFLSDMLNKNSSTINKNKPDRLLVYNYNKDSISDINLNNIKYKTDHIELTDKGFTVGDIRVQIGWQNGNGLNNPTIRIFIK